MSDLQHQQVVGTEEYIQWERGIQYLFTSNEKEEANKEVTMEYVLLYQHVQFE